MLLIRKWSDKQLIDELRSPIRATIGPDAYHLLLAETGARLLERTPKRKKPVA
jgi:hypothetical protein